jgi:hypothetical protein
MVVLPQGGNLQVSMVEWVSGRFSAMEVIA